MKREPKLLFFYHFLKPRASARSHGIMGVPGQGRCQISDIVATVEGFGILEHPMIGGLGQPGDGLKFAGSEYAIKQRRPEF